MGDYLGIAKLFLSNLSVWKQNENDDLCITNLIGQAMERTGQTIHGSAEGQVGVRQGTPH